MKHYCVFFVLLSFQLFGQQVTFTHVLQFPFQNFETIQSGDTVNIFAEDQWAYPVHVDFNGYQNGTLNFRIVDLDGNTCFPDQFRVYVIPDPNFESSCMSPNSSNYLSPDFNSVNIEGGDTVIIQSEGYVQCGGCNQFRYFVELDQVILDSFDIRVCQSLANLDNDSQASLNLFPNPAKHQLNWDSEMKFLQYAIYDAQGVLVEKNKLFSAMIIQTTDLPEGLYMLEMVGVDEQLVRRRFIIKRN